MTPGKLFQTGGAVDLGKFSICIHITPLAPSSLVYPLSEPSEMVDGSGPCPQHSSAVCLDRDPMFS
jgi:hypothetical protein